MKAMVWVLYMITATQAGFLPNHINSPNNQIRSSKSSKYDLNHYQNNMEIQKFQNHPQITQAYLSPPIQSVATEHTYPAQKQTNDYQQNNHQTMKELVPPVQEYLPPIQQVTRDYLPPTQPEKEYLPPGEFSFNQQQHQNYNDQRNMLPTSQNVLPNTLQSSTKYNIPCKHDTANSHGYHYNQPNIRFDEVSPLNKNHVHELQPNSVKTIRIIKGYNPSTELSNGNEHSVKIIRIITESNNHIQDSNNQKLGQDIKTIRIINDDTSSHPYQQLEHGIKTIRILGHTNSARRYTGDFPTFQSAVHAPQTKLVKFVKNEGYNFDQPSYYNKFDNSLLPALVINRPNYKKIDDNLLQLLLQTSPQFYSLNQRTPKFMQHVGGKMPFKLIRFVKNG